MRPIATPRCFGSAAMVRNVQVVFPSIELQTRPGFLFDRMFCGETVPNSPENALRRRDTDPTPERVAAGRTRSMFVSQEYHHPDRHLAISVELILLSGPHAFPDEALSVDRSPDCCYLSCYLNIRRLGNMQASQTLTQTFAALGDLTRLAILSRLAS